MISFRKFFSHFFILMLSLKELDLDEPGRRVKVSLSLLYEVSSH